MESTIKDLDHLIKIIVTIRAGIINQKDLLTKQDNASNLQKELKKTLETIVAGNSSELSKLSELVDIDVNKVFKIKKGKKSEEEKKMEK